MRAKAPGELAVIYARYSDPKQDKRSLEDQIHRCRQHAEAETNRYQVTAVYRDAAITGRHSARADFQRLLADAKERRFRHVLIFDVARFSRSLGVLWDVIFGRLKRCGVVVTCVSTNTRSDSPNARMVFGTMGLVSDLWCQMIGDETRKALDGRARSGFHPGGKTYGYTTVPEPNPPDPAHPRKLRVIEPSEAETVVLVFELAAKGTGYKSIAAELNRRGLAAPHDGKRGNKKILGWGHGTVRAMIRNEEYIGRDRWGQFTWTLLDDGVYEKAAQEDADKQVAYKVPAIVPMELWSKVQERVKRTTGRGRRAHFGSGKHRGWLLSGLVKCGVCGSPMSIVSRKHKPNGSHYANVGCKTHDHTGGSMCTNNRTLSEEKVVGAVIGELRKMLTHPDLVKDFEASLARRFKERQKTDKSKLGPAEKRVHDAQRRVGNMVAALADVGYSKHVRAGLEKEEAALKEAEQALEQERKRARPNVLPHPTRIRQQIDDLLAVLGGEDMSRARAELTRYMPPVILKPVAGGWEVTGGFDFSLLLPAGLIGGVGGTAYFTNHRPSLWLQWEVRVAGLVNAPRCR